ncbi:ATP-binding protein [Zhouia sp. PK063]|uniref:PAS domain-containing sensor histidine kinase n=1 Tax=Zhouia sp. PK063 TaxID=3373602 RepID=UPI0037A1B67D
MFASLYIKNKNIINLLFDTASEGIIVINSNQEIVAANKAAIEIFGYDAEELLHQPVHKLVPVEHHAKHHEHVKNFIHKGNQRRIGQDRHLYGIKKNGEYFPIEAGLSPFEIEDERYVMALLIDITLRKKAQDEVRELNNHLEEKIKIRTEELSTSLSNLTQLNNELEQEIKHRKLIEQRLKKALQKEKELSELKTKFLSLVSHEFKTPLSGILSSATLAEKYESEEVLDKRIKHLHTIKNKVHYLNNILNDFLSLERLDGKNGQYKYSFFNLTALVETLLVNLEYTLKKNQNIIFENTIHHELIYHDEKIIELIITNLLSNAIKYSEAQKPIYLHISTLNAQMRISVKDDGVGIPLNDQKHIFERYFRAENAILTPGTGIGLNIIKSHLDNFNGSIAFESKENEGTTFTITIPLKENIV